jgi:hypothetical protein
MIDVFFPLAVSFIYLLHFTFFSMHYMGIDLKREKRGMCIDLLYMILFFSGCFEVCEGMRTGLVVSFFYGFSCVC